MEMTIDQDQLARYMQDKFGTDFLPAPTIVLIIFDNN